MWSAAEMDAAMSANDERVLAAQAVAHYSSLCTSTGCDCGWGESCHACSRGDKGACPECR